MQIISDAGSLTDETREVLEVALLMYGIGISSCEEKYGLIAHYRIYDGIKGQIITFSSEEDDV